MVAQAPITILSVSRNYLQYLSFNLVNIPQNFMTGKQRNSELSGLRQIDFKNICGYQVELIDKPDQAFVPSPIQFRRGRDQEGNLRLYKERNI